MRIFFFYISSQLHGMIWLFYAILLTFFFYWRYKRFAQLYTAGQVEEGILVLELMLFRLKIVVNRTIWSMTVTGAMYPTINIPLYLYYQPFSTLVFIMRPYSSTQFGTHTQNSRPHNPSLIHRQLMEIKLPYPPTSHVDCIHNMTHHNRTTPTTVTNQLDSS